MSDEESPEALAAIHELFTALDAVLMKHCDTVEDQIGVLLTSILTRVAIMSRTEGINPKREIDKITSAMRQEWRAFQRLVETRPAVH